MGIDGDAGLPEIKSVKKKIMEQEWKRRALLNKYGKISPAMEKILKRDESIALARSNVGTPDFDQAARTLFWSRFRKYIFTAALMLVLAFVSFFMIQPLYELAGIVVFAVTVFIALFVYGKGWTCTACWGIRVNRLPAYCTECGETYLFHPAGKRLFDQKQERIDKQVRAYMEKEFGAQDRLLKKLDSIASANADTEMSQEQLEQIEQLLQEVKKDTLPSLSSGIAS